MSTITNILAKYNCYRKLDGSNQFDHTKGNGQKAAIPAIEIRRSSVYSSLAFKIKHDVGVKQTVPNRADHNNIRQLDIHLLSDHCSQR